MKKWKEIGNIYQDKWQYANATIILLKFILEKLKGVSENKYVYACFSVTNSKNASTLSSTIEHGSIKYGMFLSILLCSHEK